MEPLSTEALRVIVTGGARGIGAAAARLLAAGGASVLITDVPWTRKGSTLRPNWAPMPGTAPSMSRDCRTGSGRCRRRGCFRLGQRVVQQCRHPQLRRRRGLRPEEFRRVIDVNLIGIFLGMHAVAMALRKGRRRGDRQHLLDRRTTGVCGAGRDVSRNGACAGSPRLPRSIWLQTGSRVVSLHPGLSGRR